jgi:gliding motility-associated-like protein
MQIAAMKKKLLRCFAALVLGLLPVFAYAQSCIPTGLNGTIIDYVCPQACTNISMQIPHVKGTTNYTVSSIDHTPYPWVTPTGVELVQLYADDRFSPVINLPFPFCFYGSVYNSCVVGSNGIISFDVSNANLVNGWSLTTVPHGSTPQPIPYAGGSPNTTSETYYPRASIMGAYHDIFPLLDAGGDRRIEYSIVGTAPCRKFVVSFYVVPLYGSAICNGRYCTQQIVLHENTGIIDVHLGDKPVCNEWNEGLAILGVQNWNRDSHVAAPGKNCTVWNETSTSYRFTPSGPGSRFVRSQMFTLGGSLVATADTLTTTPGLLDIRFLNFCPPPDTTRYEVRTTFSSCNNPATQLVSIDTVTTIRGNNLHATATSTNSACGPPSGTITVTVPPGAGTSPFTYILDGGAPVVAGNSYTFTGVLHGAHTIVVTDANNACTSTINHTVGRNNALNVAASSTATYCAGSSSGTITVTVSNGVGPYTIAVNGGSFFSGFSPYTISGLSAGTYSIVVTDATGCMCNPVIEDVVDGPGVQGNTSSTPTSCPAINNGTITVTATAGVAPFNFSLDGGPPQTGSNPYVFTNVSPGPHSIVITDNVGCNTTVTRTVNSGPVLTAGNSVTPTSCNGAADGTITVTALSGVSPYRFSLDGGPLIIAPSPYTFTNVNANLHTIQVTDAVGCVSQIYSVTVPFGPDLTSTATKTDVLCNGEATGTITVNIPGGGASPHQYSIDGINWQTSRIFTGLAANNYTVQFRSADGCTGSLNITVNQPTAVNATLSMIPVLCNGQSNGQISISASGGVPPYQYSINGGSNWQSSNQFAVPAGIHTIITRDVNGCLLTRSITVTEPATLTALSNNTNATCDGGNDGVITVIASGGNNNYFYSIDGNNYQASRVFNVGPGQYTIYVRDNLGCATSFQTTVGLNFNLYLAPMADPTICEGSSTQLQPVSNATQYRWSPAVALSDPTIANPIANPVDTTMYYLVADLGRCTLRDTIRLNVIKAPIPNAGSDTEICYGQSHTLQGSGGTEYSWSPALYLNTTIGPNPVSTPTINTTYTLSIRDQYGCPSLVTDQITLLVKKIMSVHTYPFDTIVAPGERFQLLARSPGNIYNWTPSTGLSDPNIPNPIISVGTSVGNEIHYKVTAINSDGCVGEGYVRIKVHMGPAIHVPTAFTPNGDGRNDSFTPHPVGIKSYNYFRVYNRWGQMIFSTTRLHEGWDGKIGGTDQPTGTYVWMIEGVTTDNKLITKKGTVTLLR